MSTPKTREAVNDLNEKLEAYSTCDALYGEEPIAADVLGIDFVIDSFVFRGPDRPALVVLVENGDRFPLPLSDEHFSRLAFLVNTCYNVYLETVADEEQSYDPATSETEMHSWIERQQHECANTRPPTEEELAEMEQAWEEDTYASNK